MRRGTGVSVAAVVALVTALALGPLAAAQPPDSPPPPSQPGGQPPSSQPPGSAPESQGPPTDSDDADQAALEGSIEVAELATVLDSLDAFAQPVPESLVEVMEVVLDDDVPYTEWSRDELLAELTLLSSDAEVSYGVLVGSGVLVSEQVTQALTGPGDSALAQLESGESPQLDPTVYLYAIDDLVSRNGRPPQQARTEPSGGALAAAIDVRYGIAFEEDVDPEETDGTAEPAPTTVEVETAQPTASEGSSDDGGSAMVWIVVVVVGLAVAVGVVIGLRRRDPGPKEEAFDELLELSRTLARARTPSEVEQLVATELARLFGQGGTCAAAIVHRGAGGLEIGFETDDGLLVPERLADGALKRIVETGQPSSAVVDHEPAFRSLPAAYVAAAVIGDGRVESVAIALRSPERPFSDADVEFVRRLGPIAAAALDSARHADESNTASLTDPLTGVGNRRKLEQDLPNVLIGADGATSVVMVDLDHFKRVNDDHGHPAGDAMLREVAAALRGVMRPGDGVYRYGGEEFALVLPETAERGALSVAERAREAVRATAVDVGGGTTLSATASLGVAATVGRDDLDGLGLIARADRALYRAKEEGRDRVVAAGTLATET